MLVYKLRYIEHCRNNKWEGPGCKGPQDPLPASTQQTAYSYATDSHTMLNASQNEW